MGEMSAACTVGSRHCFVRVVDHYGVAGAEDAVVFDLGLAFDEPARDVEEEVLNPCEQRRISGST